MEVNLVRTSEDAALEATAGRTAWPPARNRAACRQHIAEAAEANGAKGSGRMEAPLSPVLPQGYLRHAVPEERSGGRSGRRRRTGAGSEEAEERGLGRIRGGAETKDAEVGATTALIFPISSLEYRKLAGTLSDSRQYHFFI